MSRPVKLIPVPEREKIVFNRETTLAELVSTITVDTASQIGARVQLEYNLNHLEPGQTEEEVLNAYKRKFGKITK